MKGACRSVRKGRQKQSHLTQMSQVGIKGRAFLVGGPRAKAGSPGPSPPTASLGPTLEPGGDPRGKSGSGHGAREFLFCSVGAGEPRQRLTGSRSSVGVWSHCCGDSSSAEDGKGCRSADRPGRDQRQGPGSQDGEGLATVWSPCQER